MTPKQLNTIFKSFLDMYSVIPDVPNAPTFLGFPNNTALPPTREFTVFTMLFESQKTFSSDYFEVVADDETGELSGTWTVAELFYVRYQVDFYGTIGQQRRQRCRSLFNSGVGAQFFKQYYDKFGGVGIVRASDSVNQTQPDGTSEYARRFSTDFTVAVRLSEHVSQDWLETLSVTIMGVKENGN